MSAPSWAIAATALPEGSSRSGETDNKRMRTNIDGSSVAPHIKDKNQKKLFLLLLASAPSLFFRMKDVECCLFDVFIFKQYIPLLGCLRDAGKAYAAATNAAGKGHAIGPPVPHVWAALIKYLQGQSLPQPAAISTYAVKLASMSMEEVCDTIRVLKLARTFNKEFTKVFLHSQACEIRNDILTIFANGGGTKKLGTAPRNNLERETERFVLVLEGDK